MLVVKERKVSFSVFTIMRYSLIELITCCLIKIYRVYISACIAFYSVDLLRFISSWDEGERPEGIKQKFLLVKAFICATND